MTGADRYREPLRRFVAEELLEGRADELDHDTPLLELGVIDSFSLAEIVTFVEAQFAIAIPDGELKPTSFASVGAIAELCDRLAIAPPRQGR